MTDYEARGMGPKPKLALIVSAVAGVLAILVVGGLTFMSWQKSRNEAIATASEWTITGAPCPEITQAQFDAIPHKARLTDFWDMKLERANGHVDCQVVKTNGGKGLGSFSVCQLTSPQIVRVEAKKGDKFFNPGFGQAVTVTSEGGTPHCVLAGKFKVN
ncbi:hypothetical protein [Phenylobacterium deserti]|uniref:Uncharacterized protein n=1 Tax=Phenylobacterium deserti TaxID=1914756 RepID=A0A328AQ22_9CAUL|nr:hypothetical protein [Phenylobacterium deserti]RAK56455.1 hypothetical protein DJ018_00255 [Phenylobacterium deserti]